MTLDEVLLIRDQISALLLEKVQGDVDAEHTCVSQAAKQLEQFGCMGGSTRAKAEAEVVRLLIRFNDTLEGSFGPWPVSKFMMSVKEETSAYRKALQACIDAHKTGRYEPMVAAVEAAENVIEDLSR